MDEVTAENATMNAGSPDMLEQQVLRTAPEPWTLLSDAEVHAALTRDPAAYFRHMHDALQDIADGRLSVELPPKQIFADPGAASDFRVMPCVVRGNGRVTKTVKLVGTNIAQHKVPDQITVGKALVLDAVENFVTHVADACLLSSARTGLCAALAMKLLAPRHSRLTVIGSGRVGYYAAFYAAAACGTGEIVFSDRDPQRADTAAGALARRLPGVACRAVALKALPDTDIVVLATTSERPLCSPPAWKAGLVVSLGADIDHQSELDASWAQSPEIFVDTRDSARFGDLKHWLAQGLLQPQAITDLVTLLQRQGPAPTDTCRLFVSTGSALLDNLTLGYLLQQPG